MAILDLQLAISTVHRRAPTSDRLEYWSNGVMSFNTILQYSRTPKIHFGVRKEFFYGESAKIY
jgi:hypothetical protein